MDLVEPGIYGQGAPISCHPLHTGPGLPLHGAVHGGPRAVRVGQRGRQRPRETWPITVGSYKNT